MLLSIRWASGGDHEGWTEPIQTSSLGSEDGILSKDLYEALMAGKFAKTMFGKRQDNFTIAIYMSNALKLAQHNTSLTGGGEKFDSQRGFYEFGLSDFQFP